MNLCMSSAVLEHLAWVELNFERGTPSAAREPSNRDSGMDPGGRWVPNAHREICLHYLPTQGTEYLPKELEEWNVSGRFVGLRGVITPPSSHLS